MFEDMVTNIMKEKSVKSEASLVTVLNHYAIEWRSLLEAQAQLHEQSQYGELYDDLFANGITNSNIEKLKSAFSDEALDFGNLEEIKSRMTEKWQEFKEASVDEAPLQLAADKAREILKSDASLNENIIEELLNEVSSEVVMQVQKEMAKNSRFLGHN